MITVQQAEEIINTQQRNYGTERLNLEEAAGRALAEDIYCDRDLPAYDRVTMDGIAIRFPGSPVNGSSFSIKGTQAAGDQPIELSEDNGCIEIMTGAALPAWADTVIPYEDINIAGGQATITISTIRKGQNIHYRASDRKRGDIVVPAGTFVDPSVTSIAATTGKSQLTVKKQPRIIIISTGDELVDIDTIPNPYQLRRSNDYTIKAILRARGQDADVMHLPDDAAFIEKEVKRYIDEYDVLILSGGVSMGKYDYLPAALEKAGVKQLFHKVRQRPGKPFWFGTHNNGTLVFAFPGNPVSAFMCLHRYCLPWLQMVSGATRKRSSFAVLGSDVTFTPQLQYFLQVKITCNEQGQLIATPLPGNGSGDLANLLESDGFLELPLEKNDFKAGDVYPLWPFKEILR